MACLGITLGSPCDGYSWCYSLFGAYRAATRGSTFIFIVRGGWMHVRTTTFFSSLLFAAVVVGSGCGYTQQSRFQMSFLPPAPKGAAAIELPGSDLHNSFTVTGRGPAGTEAIAEWVPAAVQAAVTKTRPGRRARGLLRMIISTSWLSDVRNRIKRSNDPSSDTGQPGVIRVA